MRRSTLAVCLIIAAAPAISIARAQARSDCDVGQVEKLGGNWANLRPSRIKARLAPLEVANRWADAADSIRAIFTTTPASLDSLSPSLRVTLTAELDSLRADMLAAERDPAHPADDRFQLAYVPVGDADSYQLFGARNNTPHVVVDDKTNTTLRRTICLLSFAASDLVGAVRSPQLARLAAAFAKVDARWDNFMNHGYSMLPLELWVNGRLIKHALLEPPTHQVILAHLSAAEQMFAASFKNATRNDVLALEPIGMISYSADNSSYVGASAIVTYPASGGIAYGIMVHSSQLGHAAAIRQEMQGGAARYGALVSIDLYRRITSTADKLAQFKGNAIANCVGDTTCAKKLLIP